MKTKEAHYQLYDQCYKTGFNKDISGVTSEDMESRKLESGIRNSHRSSSVKEGVLKYFANFTGKRLF